MSYTPTTDQVRDGYSIDPEGEYRDPINASANRRWAAHAFDRWLAAHDAALLEAQSTELALHKTRARLQVLVAELNADLDRTEAERDAARATIDEARMRLHAASIPLGMSELAFAEATIRDARAILSRGAQPAAESSEP